MLNKTRAMDLAFGRAEIATYLRMPAECEPAVYGHFQTPGAALMRLPGLRATTLVQPSGSFDSASGEEI